LIVKDGYFLILKHAALTKKKKVRLALPVVLDASSVTRVDFPTCAANSFPDLL
jgi:hypothetical protein